MKAYADTSFVLSLYLPDANSARAVSAQAAFSLILLTPLGELEVVNAVHLRRFRRELKPLEAAEIFASFHRDVSAQVFSQSPMPAEVYARAAQLARRHTSVVGARSLDILHVASALLLGADVFCTFDRVQARLAKRSGLKTL